MMKTNNSSQIQAKIKIAEDAVKEMMDPELKKIAFQTVLQNLLAAEAAEITADSEKKPAKEASKRKMPKGPKGRIELLVTEGFFSKQRSLNEVKTELENHTWYHSMTDISPSLVRLVQDKVLRRVKVAEKTGKLVWKYSNW